MLDSNMTNLCFWRYKFPNEENNFFYMYQNFFNFCYNIWKSCFEIIIFLTILHSFITFHEIPETETVKMYIYTWNLLQSTKKFKDVVFEL